MWHELLLLISMSNYFKNIFFKIFHKSDRRRRSMSLGSDWSYFGELGPENWHKNFPVAASEHQSPINIDTHDLIHDPYLSEINLNGYNTTDSALNYHLRNTGYSVKVDLNGSMQILEEDQCYEAYSLLFHWGGKDSRGSEHTIDHKQYPLEIQIMHRNVRYDFDNEEVLYKLDGIKALAFFAEVGESGQEGLDSVTEQLDKIEHKGNQMDIKAFPLASLLPLDRSKYYKYPGSLTAPPCNECVEWIVFQKPIKVSKEQLAKFRTLKRTPALSFDQEPLQDNFRPIQNIHKRRVTATLQLQDMFELQI